MAKKKFRFDFALSFAAPQRDKARDLFNALKKKGFNVFFDEEYEAEMFGKNGVTFLRKVYSEESRYCIILVSREYDQRDWPRIERESIQSRELNHEEEDALLPVLTDGYKPEWLPKTRFYFNLEKKSFKRLVEVLEEKALLPLERTETKEKKTVNCDDYNWDKLLKLIKSKSVVPVISQGLYSILTKENEELLLYDFLAQQMAQKIGGELNSTFTNSCDEFLKKKCGQLKKVLTEALEGVQLTPNSILLKLARIRYFDIFFTTAYDNLLGDTIKETSNLRLEVRSYAKNQKKFDLLERELFDNIRDSQCLLVYHMLGNIERNFAPAYTVTSIRDTLIQFLEDMKRDFQNKNHLFRELKNRYFLFLGFKPEDQVLQAFIPGFANWLSGTKRDSSTRLFIGGIRGFNENKHIGELLEHLRTDELEIIDFMESEDFVNCLCQKLE